MFTTLEKERYGSETRRLAMQVWELRESVIATLGTSSSRWTDLGPVADLLRAYQVLADSAVRWEGK
jgi:hypothetical protein